MNQEIMHTGIRSMKVLNSREACSTAHKRTKPMERTKPTYKIPINGACFLSSSVSAIAVVFTRLFGRQAVHLLRAYCTEMSRRMESIR